MATVQHIAHRADLSSGVWGGWGIICENVSQNVKIGYNGAFQSLMGDVGHRDNILNARVNRLGIGIRKYG
jgi:uncharacterized protein YkwD